MSQGDTRARRPRATQRRGRRWWRLIWPLVALAPVVVALLIAQPIFSQGQDHTPRGAMAAFPLSHGHWELKLNSVFTGNQLPPVWSSSRFDNGQIAGGFNSYEFECFDPADATVGGGQLTLHVVRQPESCNGRSRPFSSGLTSTVGRWSFRYGLVEARIWVPSRGNQIADWPAVWLAQNAEIDIFEGGRVPCWYYHADHHRWGHCVPDVNLTGGWHTVAVNWQPTGITWYYDRHEVASLPSSAAPISSTPKALILDLAIAPWRNEPRVVPASFRINWVRVWQRVA